MRVRFALSGALALLLGSYDIGQEITATILGSVTDASGAVVSGATIIVLNTDRAIVLRRLTTSRRGEYVVPLLHIGHYNISAEAPGFETSLEAGIELNVNDRRSVNFILQIQGVSNEIKVEAEPLQVDLQGATAAGLVYGTQVRELAINPRNYSQLVALQPGVSSGLASDQPYVGVSALNGGVNSVSFSINGARDSQNNWTLDGADNVDRGSNHTLLTFPSIDSIAEFKVLRGNYDAEFGRGSGGQINVVTRSGTSSYHGSAYEFFRNDVLAANNFFNNLRGLARPPLRYNNFGFTIGGPVFIPRLYAKKTFFFFSEEWRRVVNYSTFTSAEVPTRAELQGTFAAPVCTKPIIDPITQLCVGPTTTQIVDIDPTAAAFFKYTHDSIPTEEPGGFGTGSNLPGVATTQTNAPGSNIAARLAMVITPHFVNELGYSYSHGAILSQPVGLLSETLSP